MCWSLVVTPVENINLQIDVYLNSRLLENFRLSSLRFVSQNRSGVCLALGFGLFNATMSYQFHRQWVQRSWTRGKRDQGRTKTVSKIESNIEKTWSNIWAGQSFIDCPGNLWVLTLYSCIQDLQILLRGAQNTHLLVNHLAGRRVLAHHPAFLSCHRHFGHAKVQQGEFQGLQ